VDDSKANVLEDLVVDRWDSGMMLGGTDKVRNLICKHISTDNEELKSCINEWLRFLKWHQEFDWEEVTESVLFGYTKLKIDVFWENEEYHVPDKYVSTPVWTPEMPNFADNVRHIVGSVPGFFYIKKRYNVEALDEKKHDIVDKGIGQNTLDTFVTFGQKFSVSSQSKYCSDTPSNKFASKTNFMRHTLWKNNTFDGATDEVPSKKPMNVKARLTQSKQKCSSKRTSASKRRAFKRGKILSKSKAFNKGIKKRKNVNYKSKNKMNKSKS